MRLYGVELIEQGDMVIQHQRQTGLSFESESISAWRSAGPGLRIDIGAYTGLYSLVSASDGYRVVCFEPNPAVCERLRANIAANELSDLIDVNHHACGYSYSVAILGLNGTPLSSGGSLVKSHAKQIPVRVVTIDGVIDNDTEVAAIKIDVEGNECNVLKGAIDTITKSKPLIITEALTKEAEIQQIEILCSIGYTYTRADEHNLIWNFGSKTN